MRIAEIWAENLKGFENFRCACSDVNIAAGVNGSNKTSFLTIITALAGNLKEKGNPRILRAGTEHGEIGMRIASDDGTETWDVRREIEPGKLKTPTVTSSISGPTKSPVAWLAPLIDKISIEPISRAMNATEEEQVEILLSTIPMAVEQSDLTAAVDGIDVSGITAHLKNAPRMPSGLDAIAAIHKAIYDHRTNVNRDAKLKRDHAGELLAGIPQSAGDESTEWKAKAEELSRAVNRSKESEQAARLDCETKLGDAKRIIVEHQSRDESAIDADINSRIMALEQERSDRKSRLSREVQDERDSLTIAHQAVLQDISNTFQPEIQRLTAEHAVAQQHALDQVGHERTRAIAAERNRESAVLKEKSDAMTAALDRLDTLKVSLLTKLDSEIPGLSVEGGVIAIKGVPLSEMNTAERVKFWLKIGARRAGELGACCVDGLECLDPKQFDMVVKSLLGSGLQWFVGKVDGLPFRVEAISAE